MDFEVRCEPSALIAKVDVTLVAFYKVDSVNRSRVELVTLRAADAF